MTSLIVCDRDHSAFSLEGDGFISAQEAKMLNIAVGHATRELSEQGKIFALCSGNDFKTLSQSCNQLGWDVPFISSKCGTELFQRKRDDYEKDAIFSSIMTDCFDWKMILFETREALSGFGISFIPHKPEKNGDGKASGWMNLPSSITEEQLETRMTELLTAKGFKVKVQVSDVKEADELTAAKTFGMKRIRNLDVLHENAGKGAALKRMIDIVNPAEFYVMGDSMNDRELIQRGANVIMPKNACDTLRKVVHLSAYLMSSVYYSQLPAGAALLDVLSWDGHIDLAKDCYAEYRNFKQSYGITVI